MIGDDVLLLTDSYTRNVTIEVNVSVFAGELNLNSNGIFITIRGEETEKRRCEIIWNDELDFLTCHENNATYYLYDLRLDSASSRTIDRFYSYFEMKFEVKNVLFIPVKSQEQVKFNGINILSDTISEWIGITNKQKELADNYIKDPHSKKHIDPEEFSFNINEYYSISIRYLMSSYYAPHDFKVGIEFPPILQLNFNNYKSGKEIIKVFFEIYAFFAFLIGSDLSLTKILFTTDLSSSKKVSLYFPTNKTINPRKNQAILYPLSANLRFVEQGLPEFSLNAIRKYFELDEIVKSYFEKYIRYKRMKSTEEKFLGYFRLLESLCKKTGKYVDEDKLIDIGKKAKSYLIHRLEDKKGVSEFLKNLKRFNSSKYNTEKSIKDFIKIFDSENKLKWNTHIKNIGPICKLRNDIIHANDYNICESNLNKYTKFIECLLIAALLLKIGISSEHIKSVISRIENYFYLK
jgi:hypothetical protein